MFIKNFQVIMQDNLHFLLQRSLNTTYNYSCTRDFTFFSFIFYLFCYSSDLLIQLHKLPLDKQELIQINSFCYYFFSVSKGSPFQDYKYILSLNRSWLDKDNQMMLLKHSEARFHFKEPVMLVILKRKSKQTALQ